MVLGFNFSFFISFSILYLLVFFHAYLFFIFNSFFSDVPVATVLGFIFFFFLCLFLISNIFILQVFDLWFVRCLSILVVSSAEMSRSRKGISLYRHSPVAPLKRVWRFVSRLRRAVYDSQSYAISRFRARDICAVVRFICAVQRCISGPAISSYRTQISRARERTIAYEGLS